MADHTVLHAPAPREIRAELEDLVIRDLHGPIGGDEHEEFPTSERVTDRYILGRLAPNGAVIEPDEQDTLAESGIEDSAGSGEADSTDPGADVPAAASMFCSAHGFTVCVEPDTTELHAHASWAHYDKVKAPEGRARFYRRFPHTAGVPLSLPEKDGHLGPIELDPEQPGVVLRGRVRTYEGRRLVTVFLVNAQQGKSKEQHLWLFQAELSLTAADGTSPVFVPRPENFSGGDQRDRDEQRNLAMTHRFHAQFAVGHSVAVDVRTAADDPMRAVRVATNATPGYELRHTDVPSADKDEDLPELADLVVDMKLLGQEGEGAVDLRSSLDPLVNGYRAWIERQRERIDASEARLRHDGTDFRRQAKANMDEAEHAANRIAAAIDLLESDPAALAAFRFANRAMHRQRVQSIAADGDGKIAIATRVHGADIPKNRSWRPFQLAFLLLNLPSLTDPAHPERSGTGPGGKRVADLLWFPTGGGKTEAYLGLTAYTLAVRRLQHGDAAQGGNAPHSDTGVAVLMRYTLRLLTIQQFQRAAALICACEVERRQDEDRWGAVPFRLGLWVGGRVTPNTFDGAQDWVREKRANRGGGGQGSPHQLTSCPWCGSTIEPGKHIETEGQARRTRIICPDLECPFGDYLSHGEGLPVLVVDEEIYRLVPSLVIATVDKFAQLTWKGEAQSLFGRASRYCTRHGYLAGQMHDKVCEGSLQHKAVSKGVNLPIAKVGPASAVRPPDLIVQDELHLITGPLGSLVGLYETAVDLLAGWEYTAPGSKTRHKVRPKVIASTATVRRAKEQIGMLFARGETRIFPPQGLDASDTFFSRQRPVDPSDVLVPGQSDDHTAAHTADGRRYVGLCAHGVRIKSTQIRVYVAVLAAAQKLHLKYGHNEITDPYMTLVGYFNSLRDLGGMRRLVDDDVATRLSRADQRGLARRRAPWVEELTSRRNSDDIPYILDRLGVAFPDAVEQAALNAAAKKGTGKGKGKQEAKGPQPLDVLLATNMIAVGVDVSRLGTMVVNGQPKSTAEYIQATSRVGRRHPGIVFTVYNWARPRDLSHYEQFADFHANLYRHVEALSVTPFAARAIDRGLTGLLIAMVRGYDPLLNPNAGAGHFDRTGRTADHLAAEVKRRARDVTGDKATIRAIEEEVDRRFDLWNDKRGLQTLESFTLGYTRSKKEDVGLIRHPEDGRWATTTCPTSLREVEPGIRLVLDPQDSLGEDSQHPFQAQNGAGDDQNGALR
ncbi:DISARM system helicase DrmA [Nocardiopsis sp. EMB25]|uniref:DISARM system helicase DrmA n=1 Tax=Nocardiopsis sp. EMB25 TaxID=2835867 RepID=UPI0022849EC2|nr:DISARM system helicase DrmA [Nocardiopsis sp. EMB25]MCY9782538.1 DISARM system helicase DrmA [Nocardiopsis sp. EMB25]